MNTSSDSEILNETTQFGLRSIVDRDQKQQFIMLENQPETDITPE